MATAVEGLVVGGQARDRVRRLGQGDGLTRTRIRQLNRSTCKINNNKTISVPMVIVSMCFRLDGKKTIT